MQTKIEPETNFWILWKSDKWLSQYPTQKASWAPGKGPIPYRPHNWKKGSLIEDVAPAST